VVDQRQLLLDAQRVVGLNAEAVGELAGRDSAHGLVGLRVPIGQRSTRRDAHLEQGLNAGQLTTLEELERRAAAGREVAHAVLEPERAHRLDRLPAADDRIAGVDATASPIARMPAANDASSKRPIGPFQNTIAAAAMSAA